MSLIKGPVGLRFRSRNVTNSAADQQVIIDLLASIPNSEGGKGDSWQVKPLSGPNGQCPKHVAEAIWEFQVHWKKQGVFRNIDGVADPGGNTLKRMLLLAGRGGVLPGPPEPPKPSGTLIIKPPRVAGTWQITSMWSLSLGEVGLVGGVEVEVTPPDERKFMMKGWGAGFGLSLDPGKLLKLAPQSLGEFAKATLAEVSKMIGKGIGFSIGDWLQLLGVSFGSLSATGGFIVPNPIATRSLIVTRPLITGGGVPAPFCIASAGAGAGAGMEGGVVFFNSPVLSPLLATTIGVYGSSGLNLKIGGGATAMLYHPEVKNL